MTCRQIYIHFDINNLKYNDISVSAGFGKDSVENRHRSDVRNCPTRSDNDPDQNRYRLPTFVFDNGPTSDPLPPPTRFQDFTMWRPKHKVHYNGMYIPGTLPENFDRSWRPRARYRNPRDTGKVSRMSKNIRRCMDGNTATQHPRIHG